MLQSTNPVQALKEPYGDHLQVKENAGVNIASKEEVRGYYEGAAKAKEYVEARFSSELMALLHERQVAAVQSVMNRNRPAFSLEIAPGPGRITRHIRPSGELVCLEFNSGMIAEGNAACGNGAQWVQGDAFDYSFETQFDFVYSFRFIRHFHESDRARLYSQIRKYLKPGGALVFDAVDERASKSHREAHPDEYPVYDKLYRDSEELKDELRGNGFEVVKLDPVLRWYPAQCQAQVLLGPRSRWLCRRVIRGLERVGRGPALEWIATCRRV